jgi:dTDP-glucose 4,6-dehydratase
MSNNFGPRQHVEKFLPTMIRSMIDNKKVPVYGDGKNIRDWLYVKDCASMILRVLIAGTVNQIYNLTHNNERENIDLLYQVCDLMEMDRESSFEFVEDRKGHDFRYSISNKKLLKIGIKNPTNFNTSLMDTIKFFKRKQ